MHQTYYYRYHPLLAVIPGPSGSTQGPGAPEMVAQYLFHWPGWISLKMNDLGG